MQFLLIVSFSDFSTDNKTSYIGVMFMGPVQGGTTGL